MYVVGFVELSQRGREKGQSGGNYATLKGILVAREAGFFFNLLLPSLRGWMMSWAGKEGEECSRSKGGQKEGDEVAVFGLGESWNNLERARLQRQ